MKQEVGTIYQKPNGTYHYRYQINGERKSISLKTKNQEEAKRRVREYVQVIKAPTIEVVAAHVAHARNIAVETPKLLIAEAWQAYCRHPDRANPATVNEQRFYETTFHDFCAFLPENCQWLHEVTPTMADAYAGKLRRYLLAVDTHNRKIKQLRKIFAALVDYCPDGNPFKSASLWRKDREEQEHDTRRLAFTREPKLRESMVGWARQEVKCYSWPVIAKELARLYDGVCNG